MSAQSVAVIPLYAMLTRRTTCRACGSTNLVRFLSLGEVPLANAFLTAKQLHQPEPRFPLEVFFCSCCSLVQLLHVVDPEVLFSNYIYRTGTNQTIARHNAALANAIVREVRPSPDGLVVEIASNDGSLLQCFREHRVRTLGVEPAKNIARIAREAGIETIDEFFDARTADGIVRDHGRAIVVVANNVLAHIDRIIEFLTACASILQPDGWLVIEVPYLAEMLARLEYDTIYHEHLCYFSVTALMRLFSSASLALVRIDHIEIHGGSLRLWARQVETSGHAESVRRMAGQELADGLTCLTTYEEFARGVQRNRERLVALVHRLKSEGKSVVGYGAPAKGNTLLCYCGIGTDLIPYTADRSPLKVGLYTPGTHIPVLPVEHLLNDRPDYVLILAWNFASEIMESLQRHQQRGGRFILPVPEPLIV